MLGDVVARAYVPAEQGRVDDGVEADGVPSEEDLQSLRRRKVHVDRDDVVVDLEQRSPYVRPHGDADSDDGVAFFVVAV